ncbi:unnamed protein product [Vicia faba]|uniref:IST1-like protein n=1 Tax=Vicia faba TaxID=3906 RepID=A0AAV0ZD18_VICFA|nr:unnamed protein product [Vicia faba]
MFGILFGWTKASKCKKAIKRARFRLIQLKNKRQSIAMQLRKDLADLILNGHEKIAIQRVEKLIQDESLIAAYEMLNHFFDFILKQLSYIRKNKDCPTEINEAVSSVIFASSRCGDFPDLYHIKKLFAHRYGDDFATAAIELLPGNLVNTKLKENLSVKSVPDDTKHRVVDEIFKEYATQIEGTKMYSPSEFDQEVETDVTSVSLSITKPSDEFSVPESTSYDTSTLVSPKILLDSVDDIDECEYFSSKDACTQQEQRLVLFNSSESDTDQDGSSIESSLRSYTVRNCASSKKRLRRSPLLDKQGRVEIGYTLYYQTPSPQSSYPKKRLKQHSYSDSCERNSLDFNMSECSCDLESPCYCFVYNEIEMFEYTGNSSSTNVFHQKTCDCLTTTPYSRDLTLTMPSKWMENYKENQAMTFSCPSPRPKHVHPKLPDYDDFVATFMALKRECNLRRQ